MQYVETEPPPRFSNVSPFSESTVFALYSFFFLTPLSQARRLGLLISPFYSGDLFYPYVSLSILDRHLYSFSFFFRCFLDLMTLPVQLKISSSLTLHFSTLRYCFHFVFFFRSEVVLAFSSELCQRLCFFRRLFRCSGIIPFSLHDGRGGFGFFSSPLYS